MEWVKYVVAILSGLAASIPLVIKLVQYVKEAIKEKNWSLVMEKVVSLMETAEEKFSEGAERKEWVLAMLKASADGINYDIDYDAIGDMIDALCDMSKVVNGPNETEAGTGETADNTESSEADPSVTEATSTAEETPKATSKKKTEKTEKAS